MREVMSEPLTASGFAPFGDVVSAEARDGISANLGTAVRFDWVAELASTRPGAKANVAVFRSTPKTLPFRVEMLERHVCSSQMFIPMECTEFLVVVAQNAADGFPDLATLRAFRCRAGQGFNYRPGVWHHPIIALNAPAQFMMLAWEDGSKLDCEERKLSEPVAVL